MITKDKDKGAATDRQWEILRFLKKFITEHRYAPTYREIAKHFDISVKCAVDHITALKRKGYIKTENKISRSITIIEEKN